LEQVWPHLVNYIPADWLSSTIFVRLIENNQASPAPLFKEGDGSRFLVGDMLSIKGVSSIITLKHPTVTRLPRFLSSLSQPLKVFVSRTTDVLSLCPTVRMS